MIACPYRMPLAFLLATAGLAAAQPAASPLPREAVSQQDYQKLLDQLEQLKKELAAKKTLPPSGCSIHARIEKRGDASVAALKLTYSFRTAAPNVVIALGAKRSFLVSTKLDGQPLPVLESGDTGFTVLVETPGNHTAVLEVECPITARGTKPEIGFELGLPRAAITTLAFEPPPGVSRLTMTTRTPEAGKVGEPRRVAGLDAKSLAPPAPMRDPYPLGPVESLELAWEPVAAAPVADAVQTAEVDATALVTEGLVETTAKFKLRGIARTWQIVAPADAVVSVDRVAGESPEAAAVAKPADAAGPCGRSIFPPRPSPADWVATVIRTTRAQRRPAFRGPFAIGPLSVLDVAKLSGTLRISAPLNTRLTFKHGRELRQDVPPAVPSEDESVGFFRLTAGPLGNLPPAAPLLTFEAAPLVGRVAVRPNYKLALTDAGWNLRAELRIVPIRTTIDSVTLELPAGWRGVELSPPTLVGETTELKADDTRKLIKVALAAEHKQPVELVLAASVPFAAGAKDAAIPLLRFPNATERDTLVSIAGPEGIDLRGTAREWDGDQPAAWTSPLPATPGPDGKPTRSITAINGKFERGVARLDVSWSPFRPPLTAEVRAELTVRESQIVVSERVTLRSADGLPRTVRFTGAADLPGLAPFDRTAPGVWLHGFAADVKEAVVKFEYAIPLPPGDRRAVPISLVLPNGTSRTDVHARVWLPAASRRTVSAPGGPWREEPPDPASERDALPALTLAASGTELPLTLDIRDSANDGTAAIAIERGLLQATHGGDGSSFRARFLLRRWSADSLDVKLPPALDGTIPEAYLDDPPKRIPAAIRTENGERLLRIPLPESRSGRILAVEIRYSLPSRAMGDTANYPAPVPRATFTGPVRWQITGPAGSVPLLLGGERSEQRWQPRFGLIVPSPAATEDLERWFLTGTADGSASGAAESAVLRMPAPVAVSFVHLPRTAFLIGCSVAVLFIGLVLSRFPGWLAGPALSVIAGAVAISATLYPQPATQFAAAAEPGFAALILVLIFQTAARWYYRQRVTYLPGFARTGPTPTASGSRPSERNPNNASTGALLPQPASTGS
ncbi:MAG: hypothetical protein U0791_09590 [Gemmataceae bacterium]